MLSFFEIKERSRDESKQVPEPKIRPVLQEVRSEGPAIFAATAVIKSQGLATMQMATFGENAKTFGIIFFMIATLRSTRFKRDSPGFCAAPAVSTITK
jgi:hypothetical protein